MNRQEHLDNLHVHNIVANFFLEENQQRYVEFTPHSSMSLVSIVPYMEKLLRGVYRLAEFPESVAIYEYSFNHALDNTLWEFTCIKSEGTIQVMAKRNPREKEKDISSAVLLACVDIKYLYRMDSSNLQTFLCSLTGVVTNLIRDYNDYTFEKCKEVLNKKKY